MNRRLEMANRKGNGNLGGGKLRIANKEGKLVDSDTIPRGNESARRDTR
jgi:hypothetical protein